MTVQTNDMLRVTAILYNDDTGLVENVYWAKQITGFQDDATWLTNTAQALEAIYDGLVQYMPDSLAFQEVRAFNITQDYDLGSRAWPALTDGDVDVANPMPSGCAALVLGRSPTSTSVSRKYFGLFTEADHGAGLWQSSLVAALAAAATSWKTAYALAGGGTAQFGVWSKVLETWYPLVEMVVKDVVAYQRRRRAGRGG